MGLQIGTLILAKGLHIITPLKSRDSEAKFPTENTGSCMWKSILP